MVQKQRYSKGNYRKVVHAVAPRNSKKENINHLNINFLFLNLHRKAEYVEVLDKGLTISIFKIYFFLHRFNICETPGN